MPAKIVQKENPVLREKAENVPLDKITSQKIKKIISDMKEAMNTQDDAVAIAAPQIGLPLNIFVVSGKVFRKKNDPVEKTPEDKIFINPQITKLSKETKLMEEGCLSVRYLYGKVRRSVKASIEAYDENGKKIKRGASGLLAQIFQHETEHLIGKLFIDKAIDIVDMPPSEVGQRKTS